MSHGEHSKNPRLYIEKACLKRRAAHGVREFLAVFLFLAPWFLAFSTYRMLLLNRFVDEQFEYGTGLVNALILSKVILTGEYLRLGKGHEHKPLIFPTIWKSFLFTLAAVAFYVVEQIVRGLLRGGRFAVGLASLRDMGAGEILGRSLVMFFAFIPFFALRETGRVLGEGKLQVLFFRPKAPAGPQEPQTENRAANGTDLGRYQAILFDMDGVITDTARIHAACWKMMLDEYLQRWAREKGLAFRPFDVATDYKAYVDGKPRYVASRISSVASPILVDAEHALEFFPQARPGQLVRQRALWGAEQKEFGSPVWTHFELFLPKALQCISARHVILQPSACKCITDMHF
jgi:hypothetical protein